MKAAIIGGGVIGGGWASRFLLNGYDVKVYDPDKEAKRKLNAMLKNAKRSLPSLYDFALPEEGKLTFCSTIEETVQGVKWIQESVPERLDIKQDVYKQIQKFCDGDAIIASSTSGFKPSELNEGSNNPKQILVCHPFNPVYLLPLVEVVPSLLTDKNITSDCCKILKNIGMKPLLVRKEIDAHIADRLIEAIWREALWLVHDDIATTEEVDDAMKYAMGLRYALMGVFEHMRLAGGEQGMHHFLKQFGPCLKWPWTKLMDVPDLTDEFVTKIATQSDNQAKGRSIQELEMSRDDTLVGILRALRATERAAGKTINEHNDDLNIDLGHDAELYLTVKRQIPQTWTDVNGHMNETNYLEVCSQATDKFMEMMGMDVDYIKTKQESYFTVETHIRHLNEAKEGMLIIAKTQVLEASGKKLRLFHKLETDNGTLIATGEHMLLHVSLKTRASCLPSKKIAENLDQLYKKHSKLSLPEGAGRSVGYKG